MGETPNNLPDLKELPAAEVQLKQRSFSIVWVVPLAALLIGGWLVHKTFSEKGPTITIAFESAEGLEAGKTKIRYKDVDLGQVTAIDLSEDLSQVIVTAELVKYAEGFISENTRFWVVKARVAATGVSGLGTLFTGVFIAMDPGKNGNSARHFKGLAEPPIITTDLAGRNYLLKAADRGSLEIGSPVYYRKVQVGKVVAHRLSDDGGSVDIEIFIDGPYDQYVYENTRFWESSGFNITLDTEGMRIDAQSFAGIVIGSIAFGLPPKGESGPVAAKETVFQLHKTMEEATQKIYEQKDRWVLHFHESVRGLLIGAPVEFYGIQVGQVVDLWLEAGPERSAYQASVVIEVEPDRAMLKGDRLNTPEERRKRIESLIQSGLRARLETGNLLTGKKLVSLDFYPEEPLVVKITKGPYPELPTIPSPMTNIGNKMSRIISRVESMPLEQIADELKQTIQGAKKITNSPEILKAVRGLNASLKEVQLLIADLRTTVTPEIDATLEQAQRSLKAAEEMIRTDSQLQTKLKTALDQIAETARSLRQLAEYLEQHPEALLQGKEKDE